MRDDADDNEIFCPVPSASLSTSHTSSHLRLRLRLLHTQSLGQEALDSPAALPKAISKALSAQLSEVGASIIAGEDFSYDVFVPKGCYALAPLEPAASEASAPRGQKVSKSPALAWAPAVARMDEKLRTALPLVLPALLPTPDEGSCWRLRLGYSLSPVAKD